MENQDLKDKIKELEDKTSSIDAGKDEASATSSGEENEDQEKSDSESSREHIKR